MYIYRFPLYGKGVDKYRFEFGVFLLNKNIEQVINQILKQYYLYVEKKIAQTKVIINVY